MIVKAPTADLDYPINYDLDDSETILTSLWSVSPVEEGGVSVVDGSPHIFLHTTSCLLTGGLPFRIYEVTNTVTTDQGRKDPRTLTIRIGPVEAVQ